MENKTQKINSRRAFLKKAAYAAPAFIALGGLNAQAGTTVGSSVFTMYVGSGSPSTTIQSNSTQVLKVFGHQGVVDYGTKDPTKPPGAPTINYSSAAIINNVYPASNPTGQWNPFKQYFSQIQYK
jgi:hypothetical protein